MDDWGVLVESGRSLWASRLDRVEKETEDVKWKLGDLVSGLEDDQLGKLARDIGGNLSASNLKAYRDNAKAWPVESRVEASWTAHRTLASSAKRFDLIEPGMTLRGAQGALGKNPSDAKHPARWEPERRVAFLVSQLQDDETNKAVRDELENKKKARAARAAAKAVEEDRSAEYREAQRKLREAREAKHPERAAYDALFKIRDAAEYVRATAKATAGENSFFPVHMRPDLAKAVRDLALISVEMLGALVDEDEATKALSLIADKVEESQASEDGPMTFDGVIVSGTLE